jgi:hypothetical protein
MLNFQQLNLKGFLNILAKGSVFEKAKNLREKQHIVRDNGDNLYFEFINTEHWCQNQFQVTHQVSIDGKYKNRYDVTLLINGLPMVQIELKRRGLELKEAFNQTTVISDIHLVIIRLYFNMFRYSLSATELIQSITPTTKNNLSSRHFIGLIKKTNDLLIS